MSAGFLEPEPPRRPATLEDAITVLRRRAETKADHFMVGETEQCLAVLERLAAEGVEV